MISSIQAAIGGVTKTRSDVQQAADQVATGGVEGLTSAALGLGAAVTTYNAAGLALKSVRDTQKALLDAIV